LHQSQQLSWYLLRGLLSWQVFANLILNLGLIGSKIRVVIMLDSLDGIVGKKGSPWRWKMLLKEVV